MGKVFRRAVMDAAFSIAGSKVTRGKSVKVRDSKNPKNDDNEATHEMREDGNLYDLKTGLVYLGAQDGYIERTTVAEREADDDIAAANNRGTKAHPVTIAKGSGEMDEKAADEALKALRDCLTRLVPKVKRKPVTVMGIRGEGTAVRNEAHWQGVTDEILANRPNASRDPGMGAYLAGR